MRTMRAVGREDVPLQLSSCDHPALRQPRQRNGCGCLQKRLDPHFTQTPALQGDDLYQARVVPLGKPLRDMSVGGEVP